MKKVLLGLVALVVVFGLGMFVAIQTATVVRQLRKPAELKANGIAEKTRTADALDYSVALDIAAPPPIVWALLTNADAYPQWNSTVTKLEGKVLKTELLKLTAKVAPDRVFELRVSEFIKNERMVWEDGGKAFLGVRTFTLEPTEGGGTRFAMSETFSGRMLPMIEGSLPDFTADFQTFAADLKKVAEKVAPPMDAPPGQIAPTADDAAQNAGADAGH